MSPEECCDADIFVYLPGSDEKLYQMIANIVGKNLQKEKKEDKVNEAARFILRSMKFEIKEMDTDRRRAFRQEAIEILKRKPTERELNKLSKELATTWKPIVRRLLSNPDAIISQIKVNYANDVREQAYQALHQWMQQASESGTVEALCRALNLRRRYHERSCDDTGSRRGTRKQNESPTITCAWGNAFQSPRERPLQGSSMPDPKWKILTRAQKDVVLYLSNILGGSLLDSLLAEELLTDANYEKLRKMRETKIDNEVAQELVVMLKKTPRESYDKFCQVLRRVDGGKDVYDRLMKEEAKEPTEQSDELSRELIKQRLPSVEAEYGKREKTDDWVYDVFLSFSGAGSRPFCRQVRDELLCRGVRVFFDEGSIEGGSHIVPFLLKALGESKYVAVFLTHEMKGSSHPEAEATVALKVHGARDRLLPFFHTMSSQQCCDADISVFLPDSDEKLYQMIAKIVGKNLQKEKEEDKVNAAARFILKSMKFAVEETDTDGGRVKGLLQEEIQEKHLRAVYLKIQAFWKRVARELVLPEYEIGSCERSHSLDEERCYDMLQRWKTRQRGKGKVRDLASAIYKAQLEGVVEEVYGESVLKALQLAIK